eukprot:1193014-Prorocentrum_minimum.AAC.4
MLAVASPPSGRGPNVATTLSDALLLALLRLLFPSVSHASSAPRTIRADRCGGGKHVEGQPGGGTASLARLARVCLPAFLVTSHPLSLEFPPGGVDVVPVAAVRLAGPLREDAPDVLLIGTDRQLVTQQLVTRQFLLWLGGRVVAVAPQVSARCGPAVFSRLRVTKSAAFVVSFRA